MKGNEKGDLTVRHAAGRWQAIGLLIGLMVLMSAFPPSVQAQTVSGNETVEASRQTMELMPVRQTALTVNPQGMPIRPFPHEAYFSYRCGRQYTTDTYVDGIKLGLTDSRTIEQVIERILFVPPLGGIPAKHEGEKEFAENPAHF